MGLLTDEIFFEALKADSTFMQAIGNRLYGTTIPVPDDKLDNVPVPYCIITYDGMNNQDTTKDDPYEGGMDVVNIGIELTAKTRKELGQLTNQVRRIIHDQFAWVKRYAELRDSNDETLETSDDFRLMVMRDWNDVFNDIPWSYTFSAEAVIWDQWRPCYGQVLRYQCSVTNTIDEDNE